MAEKINRIVWSKNALNDLKEIFDYWNKTNGNNIYSNKLNIELTNLIDLLIPFPKIGRKVENYDVRYLIKYEYIIFYKIKESDERMNIEIIQIWDSRRDPLDLRL